MNDTFECLAMASFSFSPFTTQRGVPVFALLSSECLEIGRPYRAIAWYNFLLVFVCSLRISGKENPLAAKLDRHTNGLGESTLNC